MEHTPAWLMKLPLQDRAVFTLLLAQGGEFAFVVFQAAAGVKVFPPETASLLIGAFAVSMLLSPLLLLVAVVVVVVVDKWLLPRFANEVAAHRAACVAGIRTQPARFRSHRTCAALRPVQEL